MEKSYSLVFSKTIKTLDNGEINLNFQEELDSFLSSIFSVDNPLKLLTFSNTYTAVFVENKNQERLDTDFWVDVAMGIKVVENENSTD